MQYFLSFCVYISIPPSATYQKSLTPPICTELESECRWLEKHSICRVNSPTGAELHSCDWAGKMITPRGPPGDYLYRRGTDRFAAPPGIKHHNARVIGYIKTAFVSAWLSWMWTCAIKLWACSTDTSLLSFSLYYRSTCRLSLKDYTVSIWK